MLERLAGRLILVWGWRRALIAMAAGAASVLALPPFDFFAVCFVTFPVFVWLLDGATGAPGAGLFRRLAPAFATGWWFGFGYFVAGLWWLGAALLVEPGFAWALPLAILALPAVLAIFYGLAAALARLGWRDDLGRIFALAAAFGVTEYLRATLFTGFPWNAIGYAAMPTPLFMQSASVVGVFGMNAFAVLLFSLPALAAGRRWRVTGLALCILLAGVHAGFGWYRLSRDDAPADKPLLAARIVQPSVDQSAKWDDAERERIMKRLLDLTLETPEAGLAKPSLVIWPETAIPYVVTEQPEVLVAIGETLGDDQLLLTGAVRPEGDSVGGGARYYNSIVAIDGEGQIVSAADKVHLVPFGEYLPLSGLLESLGLSRLVAGPGEFSAAARRTILDLPGGIKALPLICYEAIFPQENVRSATNADLIVNVTNDAWYGRTPGPWQHFRQAQLRAVELGLPMLRAANNGLSAGIDAKGRIIDALTLDATGKLDMTIVPGRLPQPAGNPLRNALSTILGFSLLAAILGLFARLRSN